MEFEAMHIHTFAMFSAHARYENGSAMCATMTFIQFTQNWSMVCLLALNGFTMQSSCITV